MSVWSNSNATKYRPILEIVYSIRPGQEVRLQNSHLWHLPVRVDLFLNEVAYDASTT